MTESFSSGSDGVAGRESEQGFLLVGVIVMVALVLLVLSIAAPIVAKDLRREKELEAVHRGQQYTRAIRLFYLKFNTYPASMEALEKTNNIRYLRQRYVDPMTGKSDWRLIHFGQAKTTVKGFFGEPLSGLAGAGSLGSASGLASSQQPGQSGFGGSSFGGQAGGVSGIQGAQGGVSTPGGAAGSGSAGSAGAAGSDSGSSSFGSSSFGSSSFGSSAQSGSGSSNGFGSSSGSTGPFVGVGIPKDGASIIDLNEQTDYSTWEFIYDPRIEQLYAKVSLFGGGPASTSSGSLGSASSLSGSGAGSGFGSSSFGNSGNSIFGNSGSSGSGSGSGTGTGSGTGGTTNPNPTTPPQQ